MRMTRPKRAMRAPNGQRALVFAAPAPLSCTRLASAGIVGSKHDFSGRGWGSTEVCIFCHTPHNAITAVSGSPLWNHQLSAATYTLYGSPTRKEVPEQPRAPSKLCLSCHDGTIGAFGGHTSNQFVAGAASLGTDLSNDHPISVRFRHQTLAALGALNCIGCITRSSACRVRSTICPSTAGTSSAQPATNRTTRAPHPGCYARR